MNLKESLEFRYAVKKFDTQKKISENQVQKLLEAANLTATSYGLQPYKIILVKDTILREKISDASFGQRQPAEASHLFILAARSDIDEKYIAEHVNHLAIARNLDAQATEKFTAMLTGFIMDKTSEQLLQWALKQCYIVLGNLLTCCAVENIDSCPMEGFSSAKVDELLKLSEKNLHSVVMLPLGFRSSLDKYQFIKKVRKPLSEILLSY